MLAPAVAGLDRPDRAHLAKSAHALTHRAAAKVEPVGDVGETEGIGRREQQPVDLPHRTRHAQYLRQFAEQPHTFALKIALGLRWRTEKRTRRRSNLHEAINQGTQDIKFKSK